MAQFCTKCGSPLPEGMKFCTGCGATVGATTPPPAAPPVASIKPVAPAPIAPVPAAAPGAAKPAASSGSPILKIVLVVLAILVFFGLISAGACVYMIYRGKQKLKQFEQQVHTTFPTPTGTREVHVYPRNPTETPGQPAAPVIDMGLPVYPGATTAGQGASVAIGTGTIKSQEYLTGDSTDQVLAFYKEKMGSTAIITQNGQQALLQLSGSNGYVNVAIAPDSESGKTKFKITSVGK